MSLLQEIQHKLESMQRELADQRDRDGGVFISVEKKEEMERKMMELEQMRKEYKDLSVSTTQNPSIHIYLVHIYGIFIPH